jgi:putative DNA primase/helicase
MSQTTTAKEPVTCLSVAIQYIASGLNITPVLSPTAGARGAGKAPYLDAWQAKRLTAAEFEGAFRKGSNIGVITGKTSDLVCIDIDRAVGMAWYYEHKDSLPDHITERRGATSLHLWFRYPLGVDHIASKVGLFPGVDISADGGKQVVTWPSIHRSGDPYTIDNGLTLLDVCDECDDFPKWILELVQPTRPAPAVPADLKERVEIYLSAQDFNRCAQRLVTIEPAVTGNAGDMRTYQAACVCHDYGLSESQAYELLESVYNPRCVPPWESGELREKVKNAYKYANGTLGAATGAAGFSEPLPADIDAQIEEHRAAAAYSLKKSVVSAKTYLERNPNQTLCSNNQLYRYSAADKCWSIITDEGFASVILWDICQVDPSLHESSKMPFLSEVVRAVKRILEKHSPERQLKADSWLDGRPGYFIACRNGILNILTGELLPPTPEWFSFTVVDFDYEPASTCPNFEAFLFSIWDNDNGLKESLRAWIGYVLSNSMEQQKFAVFKGASRAGKGTLVRVIEKLLGASNVAACSMGGFSEPFALQPLVGKRLAVFNDAESISRDKSSIATERIKSIVGNDSIPVNRKNLPALTMTLPIKMILACNEIPRFIDAQSSMTNRMIGFPFSKSFQGQEDFKLDEKLASELPGIFNWALEGARSILKGSRLAPSAAGLEMVDDIATQLDSVKCFVKEAVQFTGQSHNEVTNDQLWIAYEKWCQESNQYKKSRQAFFISIAPLLRDKAIPKRNEKQRWYTGIIFDVKDTTIFDDESDPIPF